jgi:hypothetical protein
VRALEVSVSALTAPSTSDVSIEAVADDLDTMRKALDDRLGGIEAALVEIRSALRNG